MTETESCPYPITFRQAFPLHARNRRIGQKRFEQGPIGPRQSKLKATEKGTRPLFNLAEEAHQ
jgi:hypothetical protein